jgi:hypothetical protein
VVVNAKEHKGKYEVQVAHAIIEKRNPRYTEGGIFDLVEKEFLVEKEVKVRENRKTAQRSWRKMGSHIRGHIKPNTLKRSRLMHVEVPRNNKTTWTKIEEKDEVEQHLIARNVEQFSHAGATPLGLTDLSRELGHTGDSATAEEILDGTLYHDYMKDDAIRAIAQQLKRHPPIQGKLIPIVSAKDFQSCFKGVPEKTASSYSGRSVPHYKACADGSKDGLADTLTDIHAAMATIPLKTGFCPERWRHAVDIMLEKIPGIARTNKLRIIQLLEADLNQILRDAFARNIKKLAQNHEGVISEHQYGRSYRTCISPILNKLITIQILIQKRKNGIIFDNDAKRCYDRIIISISLATVRRLGYSKKSVRMLGKIWEQLEHHISTGYGISENTYSGTTENLLYGIGQGSCSSPILWVLLNQLILTALGETFECITLVSVDKSNTSTRPGGSFIDDTTTGVTSDDTNREPVPIEETELTAYEEQLVEQMQAVIQFFLDLLQVTGGDLAPEKCVWYLIAHRWKNGLTTLLRKRESHRVIKITSNAT